MFNWILLRAERRRPLQQKREKTMTSGQIVFVVLVFVLLAVALLLAFAYGYTKGINDLTEEIDRGIKKLQEDDEDLF